jgi:hypothetical protein
MPNAGSRLSAGRRVRSNGPVDTDLRIVELDTTDEVVGVASSSCR